MSQKFPQVGLRAVFEITGFNRNYSRYQTLMRDIDRTTRRTAQKINQSGQQIGAGFASSVDELIQKSGLLQQAFASISMEDALASSQDLDRVWQSLGDKAQVNVDQFERLAGAGVSVADALRVAGGQVAFNEQAFDRLVQNGVAVDQAFQQVVDSSNRATSSVTILGRSFSTTALAVAAATAALRIGVRIVQESNEAYDDLAEATRRVRLQTGLLTQEASTWVTVLESSGVSTATSERALTSFLGKVADLRRDLLDGEELTSDFARAMSTLGVSVVDSQGNLRSTEAVLTDVNRAFQDLGPGIVSAQLATDLFGYSGRQLLPLLVDQEQSLSDLADEVERFGANLGALDTQKYEELRNSQTRLKESTQAFNLVIGRGWVEARTNFNNFLAGLLNGLRKADAAIRAFQKTFLSVEGQMTPFRELGELYQRNLQYFLTGEDEAARAAEESAQARANAAQDLAAKIGASESEIRAEREKTLKKLDELKTKLTRKLDDIARDAGQKWTDILVDRQRDAFDRSLQNVFKMEDIRQAYNERLDAIEADFAKRWEDILVSRQRDALLRGLRLAFRYEDLERGAEQSRLDAIRDFNDREAKQRRDLQRRIEDTERDSQRKREGLEREHQRRIRDIRQEFIDTATEAARRNDAVAVARAQRQRARDLRDEQQRYADEQEDLKRALEERRQDIERDRQRREADQQRELERTLERIQENYARQREELVLQNQRERLIREIRYRWELEDFNAAQAEQQEAAEEWRAKQEAALEASQERERILREIAYERQEIDFVKAWQRRIDEANEWYERERDDLAEHLKLTGGQLEAAYETWIQEAAIAANEVARAAAAAVTEAVSEIIRYQHLLTEAQRQAVPQRLLSGTPTPALPPQVAPYSVGPWPPGAPVFSQAEGGVMQASSPTHVVMGDAGPETAVFMPGRAGSLNVNHNFGRMGVDVNGLPGGMNPAQVENMFYALITQLAKGIQIPRT